MLYSSFPEAPYFEGSNITNFFDSYSQMCTEYLVDKCKKIMWLSWYCELFIGKFIGTLIRSLITSWLNYARPDIKNTKTKTYTNR